VTATSAVNGHKPFDATMDRALARNTDLDEKAVLGAMMSSASGSAVPGEVREILWPGEEQAGVGEHHFVDYRHKLVWKTVINLMDDGEPHDANAVLAALPVEKLGLLDNGMYLLECSNACPTPANGTFYARNVAKATLLRGLAEAETVSLREAASAALNDAEDVYERARGRLDKLIVPTRAGAMVAWEQAGAEAFDEMERLSALAEDPDGANQTEFSTGWPDLDRLLGPIAPGTLIIVAGRPGLGKALALNTPLPTPTGWTTMGEVRVGDELLGADGRPVRVVDATEVLHDRPCYEVTFSDGTVIVADALHQWYTETRTDRRAGGRGTVKTTEEIAATMRVGGAEQRVNHSIPVAKPMHLVDAPLLVPPYTLGAWLGDGTSLSAQITTADPELLTYIEEDGYEIRPTAHPMNYAIAIPSQDLKLDRRNCVVCGEGFQPTTHSTKTCGTKACIYASRGIPGGDQEPMCVRCGKPVDRRHANRQCGGCRLAHASLVGHLRQIDVYANKHIPMVYLRASESQRRQLLAGLLDTDGTVAPSGNVQFTSTSRRLAYDTAELVLGLGYRCTVATTQVRGRSADSSTAYTINFSTAEEVFRLERKKLAHKERSRTRDGKRNGVRYVTDVRPIASVPVRCVSIDNADHLYLAGRTMIPTHNSVAARNVAQHLAMRKRLPMPFFSLEMSRVEIALAMMAAGARLRLTDIKNGTLSDDDWVEAARYLGQTADAPLEIDDTAGANLAYVDRALGAVRRKYGRPPVAFALDYLQLLDERGNNRQEAVSAMSRRLKRMCKEHDTVGVVLSQLNRDVTGRTDKRPQLSDLRESGSIEQDADIVILLHRDDYYDKESPRAGEADFIVAKHRHGETDTVTMAAQLHLSRFASMAIV
jgi:replicative DNA helicase